MTAVDIFKCGIRNRRPGVYFSRLREKNVFSRSPMWIRRYPEFDDCNSVTYTMRMQNYASPNGKRPTMI